MSRGIPPVWAVSHEGLMDLTHETSLKITFLKLQVHLPGLNELTETTGAE